VKKSPDRRNRLSHRFGSTCDAVWDRRFRLSIRYRSRIFHGFARTRRASAGAPGAGYCTCWSAFWQPAKVVNRLGTVSTPEAEKDGIPELPLPVSLFESGTVFHRGVKTPPSVDACPAAVLQGSVREDIIVRICVLASGSSGNATFVAAGRTRILVDAGLSLRELSKRLSDIGEDPKDLDAVLISHEHSDHVSGLPVLARKHKIPIYLTHLTAPIIDWGGGAPHVETFQAGCRITIGDLEVDTFTIPHDAADPIAFAFRGEGVRIGLVTDLGYLPDSVKYHLQGTDLLVLESNHDLEMLKVGPYPWSVKQRVMGRKGHLSNDVVSGFIEEELSSSTATLVLAHLSENNNHPELVRIVGKQALGARCLSTKLVIAEQRRSTEVFLF